jgi:ABC-2 type transport system ATP-binding protein
VEQQTFSSMSIAAPAPSVVPNSCAAHADRPSRAPSIRLTGLTKRFSTRGNIGDFLRRRGRATVTVVDRVSFDVAAGEVFGLLGPNGAGKTTLFKMMSTMVLSDDGTATVCGHDVRTQPAAVKQVLAAVSSDERSLNWRLSARENLLLFAALHRVPQGAAGQRVASVLRTVGLESTDRKLVALFSSGMRQRLLIARALLARPRVLLLDEPTRALDPVSAQELRAFMREELVERQGCTIVLATHNADEALGFCDRVGVLNCGRLLATGPASELAARFGENRYRILTTDADHGSFARLEDLGVIHHVVRGANEPRGWCIVECSIAGDPWRSAHVLRVLHESGACIARLERIEPSLADLIGRIIGASGRGESHA